MFQFVKNLLIFSVLIFSHSPNLTILLKDESNLISYKSENEDGGIENVEPEKDIKKEMLKGFQDKWYCFSIEDC